MNNELVSPGDPFFFEDQHRHYTVFRANKSKRYENRGTFAGTRAPLQGNSNYSDGGIVVDYEERVNLPLDSEVGQNDVLQCAEDGQTWGVKQVRRLGAFRVAYLQRQALSTGQMPGAS